MTYGFQIRRSNHSATLPPTKYLVLIRSDCIFLPAEELNECDFNSGFCGWTSVGENDKWKLSSNKTFTKNHGKFVINIFKFSN